MVPAYATVFGGGGGTGTNKRKFSDERHVIFDWLYNTDNNYDAYEHDIAVAHFFFDSPTAFQFEKGVNFTAVVILL